MSVLSDLFQDIADAIRGKTGSTDKMNPAAFPTAIAGIEAGGSADVRYVTFLNHDESALGRKAVAVGDDCADPIARGVFSTPVRASDVQYDYTFAGWATTKNGSASSAALDAVTDNRTLYAAYTGAIRYYTVTYYDDDGSTVLKTETLPYGTVPSYQAAKEGYQFSGWTPTPSAVSGNAIYTAGWTARTGLDAMKWSEIAEIAESGTAAEHFYIGEKKEISFTAPDGASYTTQAEIIAFNHDDLSDGSGKAGITFRITRTAGVAKFGTSSAKWGDSSLRTALNGTTLNSMDSELRNAIKSVTKPYYWTSSSSGAYPWEPCFTDNCKIWIFSIHELIDTHLKGYKYPDINPHSITFTGATNYWSRTGYTNNYSKGISTSGEASIRFDSTGGVVFGFCI